MDLAVRSVIIETLTAPDLLTTQVHSVLLEVLVAPDVPVVSTEFDVSVELHIYEDQSQRPLTGQFSEVTTIGGWLWDRRRLEDSRWNYAQYLTTLGGHEAGLLDGTHKSWWQSGTILGCEYQDVVHRFLEDRQTWTPRITIGEYALQFDNRLLYSDYSYAGKFNTEYLQDTLMIHDLHRDTVWTSIQVALWRRDEFFSIRKHWDFKFVTEFTGELDSGARLDTTDVGGEIIPANLSSRKKEFLIDENTVVLNGSHYVSNIFERAADIPDVPVAEDPGAIFESGGAGQDDGRAVLTTYLPVQAGCAYG
jgi:hypothetical protein